MHEELRTDSAFRHAAGELLTCPFCIAVWVATLLAFGLVLALRPTRLIASVLTAVASSDFLQLAYATPSGPPGRPRPRLAGPVDAVVASGVMEALFELDGVGGDRRATDPGDRSPGHR